MIGSSPEAETLALSIAASAPSTRVSIARIATECVPHEALLSQRGQSSMYVQRPLSNSYQFTENGTAAR